MYYSLEMLKKHSKSKNIFIVISILVLLISLAICIGLCFIANKENQVIIQVVNTAITTICLWMLVYIYDYKISVDRKKIKHFKLVLSSNIKEYKGKVVKVGKLLTMSNKLLGREVIVDVNEKKYCFYLLNKKTAFKQFLFYVNFLGYCTSSSVVDFIIPKVLLKKSLYSISASFEV